MHNVRRISLLGELHSSGRLVQHALILKLIFCFVLWAKTKCWYPYMLVLFVPRWRRQSAQLRQAMAAARGQPPPSNSADPFAATGSSGAVGRMGNGHSGVDDVDDGMVKCPHCARTFNETSGARHIAVCKNTRAKPTTLKRGSGNAGGGMGVKTGVLSGSGGSTARASLGAVSSSGYGRR